MARTNRARPPSFPEPSDLATAPQTEAATEAATEAPPAVAAEPSGPAIPPTAGTAASARGVLRVELIWGDLVNVETPVAVVGRYEGLPLNGVARKFDGLLRGLIAQAIDLGMLRSELGQLFYVPVTRKSIRARDGLIVAGLGEPGCLGRDDLQYVVTNVGFATLALGYDRFATLVLGTGGNAFTPERALRAMLDGARDALSRFVRTHPAPCPGKPEADPPHVAAGLTMQVVEADYDRYQQLVDFLKTLKQGEAALPAPGAAPGDEYVWTRSGEFAESVEALKDLAIEIGTAPSAVGKDRPLEGLAARVADRLSRDANGLAAGGLARFLSGLLKEPEPGRSRPGEDVKDRNDGPSDGLSTLRLTVTALASRGVPWSPPADKLLGAPAPTAAAAAVGAEEGPAARSEMEPSSTPAPPPRLVFQYSAMSDSAVIPVREESVQSYFVANLPTHLSGAATAKQQAMYGQLLATYLLPEDFRRLIGDGQALTFVLDATTALFPWEMAGIRGRHKTLFFGPDLRLTRQFRTQFSPAPGIAPPVNNDLNVLVIADPAPAPWSLPNAQREGLAVVKACGLAQRVWGDRLRVSVTLRLGPKFRTTDAMLKALLGSLGGDERVVVDSGPCDPIEVLGHLLNDHFDVIHYAGHGVFDPANDRKGWLFRDDCVLSASEILKVRQVPRLVFANACRSSQVDTAGEVRQVSQNANPLGQVSLAEAFFARGLPNYIGAGWPIPDEEDDIAFVYRFYLEALGVGGAGVYPVDLGASSAGLLAVTPSSLGAALSAARRTLIDGPPSADGSPPPPRTNWGAYQHYGQGDARLVAPSSPPSELPKDQAP